METLQVDLTVSVFTVCNITFSATNYSAIFRNGGSFIFDDLVYF